MAQRSGSSDWERWDRQQAREAERQEAAAAAGAKAAERARKEHYVTGRKKKVEHDSAIIERRVEELSSLMAAGLPYRRSIDFAVLKRRPKPPAFDPGAYGVTQPQPQPTLEQFAPPPPGLFSVLFGGRQRHELRLAQAREVHQQALRQWHNEEVVRQQRLTAANMQHQAEVRAHLVEVEAHNHQVDQLSDAFTERQRQAVEYALAGVLARIPLPDDFPRRAEVTFNPDAEQLVVRLQLPGVDVVPVVRSYKYVQTRDEIRPVPRPIKETGELYRSVLAQVVLLAVSDLFEADSKFVSIGFNGHVSTINPGTGKPEYPCLISLSIDRAAFADINLGRVRPAETLRHLKALVSPHPYELEPITPILDFDLTKYSFDIGMDMVATLDSRPDLMQMGYTNFEHLVRQIFEAMGMQGWTTQQSNDDGVDAVVINRSPLVGGLSIVQAKRYKNAVGVNHIRELAGAMEEKKAGHGILVTTSWFTPRSWDKAREHGRIELIDGNRLTYLIKEHLGKDVVIGITRPRNATTGP